MVHRRLFANPLERRIQRVRTDRVLAWCMAGICALAASVLVLFTWVLGIGEVEGASLAPELCKGDKVLYLRQPASYDTGDVVLVNTEYLAKDKSASGGGDVIKRIGEPPQNVALESGWYWIEGIEQAVAQGALDGKVVLAISVLRGA